VKPIPPRTRPTRPRTHSLSATHSRPRPRPRPPLPTRPCPPLRRRRPPAAAPPTALSHSPRAPARSHSPRPPARRRSPPPARPPAGAACLPRAQRGVDRGLSRRTSAAACYHTAQRRSIPRRIKGLLGPEGAGHFVREGGTLLLGREPIPLSKYAAQQMLLPLIHRSL
jgi:hypothetical protein